ncbi:MAG: S-adenosylmethionine decarboxylase [Alphaproteobacteria bacterium]|nr:S-adenosylmethionine decarboxylase [Alphaproteobacteria bacterium]
MKNIAPEIFRQRLLIEGFYSIDIRKQDLDTYLRELASHLDLRIYGDPIIFSPASGMGKKENQGFDAFVPLIDSGISAYIWSSHQFFSIVIYTCKGFDEQKAINYTRAFFKVSAEIEHMSF